MSVSEAKRSNDLRLPPLLIRQTPRKGYNEGKDWDDGRQWKDHKHWRPGARGRRREALAQPTESKHEEAEHEEKLATISNDFVPVALRDECLSNTDTVHAGYSASLQC